MLSTLLELKVEMAVAYEANKPKRALSGSHKAFRHHVSNESAAAASASINSLLSCVLVLGVSALQI